MKSTLVWRIAVVLLLLGGLGGGVAFLRRGPNLSPTTQKLFLGLKSKDVAAVSAAIQEGANVNSRDEFGFTPLMCAVMDDSPSAIPALLDKGADINALTSAKETALMIAVKFKQVDVINELIAHKANLNVRSIEGQTALSLARGYRLPQIAAKLEALGAAK